MHGPKKSGGVDLRVNRPGIRPSTHGRRDGTGNGPGSTICSGIQAPASLTLPSISTRATPAAPAAAASAWVRPKSVASRILAASHVDPQREPRALVRRAVPALSCDGVTDFPDRQKMRSTASNRHRKHPCQPFRFNRKSRHGRPGAHGAGVEHLIGKGETGMSASLRPATDIRQDAAH